MIKRLGLFLGVCLSCAVVEIIYVKMQDRRLRKEWKQMANDLKEAARNNYGFTKSIKEEQS